MSVLTTGRPLDNDGEPTAGPALELPADSATAERLAGTPYPLTSGPASKTWAAVTQYPERDETTVPAILVILGPDATELPPHIHRTESEHFRAVEGEVTLVVDDEPIRLGPPETLTVEPGTKHYFRNDTDGYVTFYAEVPWFRTIEVQLNAFGMQHDGRLSSDGSASEPDFLQGILFSEYVRAETQIAVGPRTVQRLLWATVGRVGRAMGRQPVEEKYLTDLFWERTVEQPNLSKMN